MSMSREIASRGMLAYTRTMLNKNWNVMLVVKYWLLVAIVVSGLCFLAYGLLQQDLRLNANDPQIQMAEDAAAQLARGQSVQAVVPANKVDIASSLAPYMIVFDANGKPIASSAVLNGQTPTVPAGVFDSVRQGNEDRITWQPQPSVRSAIVVTQFKGTTSGFVLAGRSLREVEIRESTMQQITLILWLVLLVVTFAATALLFGRKAHRDQLMEIDELI